MTPTMQMVPKMSGTKTWEAISTCRAKSVGWQTSEEDRLAAKDSFTPVAAEDVMANFRGCPGGGALQNG